MMTCGGSRLPAVKIISTVRLNRHVNCVHAKATIEESSRIKITDGTTMTSVLA